MSASFFFGFALSSIVLTVLIALILAAKKCLQNHLSAKGQYRLWVPVFVSLAVPFLPLHNRNRPLLTRWIQTLQTSISNNRPDTLFSDTANQTNTSGWIQDFSVSADKTLFSYLPAILISIWIIGMLGTAFFIFITHRKIIKLKHSSLPVQSKEVLDIFTNCINQIGINKKIDFRSSAFLKSPVTFGLFRPCIIIPIKLTKDFNPEETRFILLHELQHCKRMDVLMNHAVCFFHIIYWFHPLLWHVRRQVCMERELACDAAVLQMLEKEQYIAYGNTLLNFAEKMFSPSSSAVSGLGGTTSQMKKRIQQIITYQSESNQIRLKSTAALIFTGILVLFCTPFITVNAFNETDLSVTPDHVTYEDYSSYFNGMEGSIVLYSLNEDQYKIYNKENSTKRFSPNSTYKIYSALIGLETKSITAEQNTLEWDGILSAFDVWNQDQTLSTAMQNSVNWYFQALDQKTGLYELKKHLNQIPYGNKDYSGGLGKFWMESSLKISPVEQVDLLRQLYSNELPFSKQNIQTVKDSLLISSGNGSSLYGKTGTGQVNNKNINGWFIGFSETAEDTYFFAVQIQDKENANGKTASNIALSLLTDLGIYIP